jgi:hypothetical protein
MSRLALFVAHAARRCLKQKPYAVCSALLIRSPLLAMTLVSPNDPGRRNLREAGGQTELEFPQYRVCAKTVVGIQVVGRIVQPSRFLPAGRTLDDESGHGDKIAEF